MTELVLDSWPVMGWLRGEPAAVAAMTCALGAEGAGRPRLAMSIINLGEVFYLAAKALDREYARATVRLLARRLDVVSARDELVWRAAEIKALHPVSYADAFAVATALDREAALLTGDPELLALGGRIQGLRLAPIT